MVEIMTAIERTMATYRHVRTLQVSYVKKKEEEQKSTNQNTKKKSKYGSQQKVKSK